MSTRKVSLPLLAALIGSLSALNGCASPEGTTRMETQNYIQQMRDNALTRLYNIAPEARNEVAMAPGYAVFDARKAQILITTTGNAYGIVHDNQTGVDTYMSAFSAGAGLGAGIKDFKAVVVFKNRQVMNDFINSGWVFGATGGAEAKSSTGGGSVSESAAFDSRLKIYTFTNQGLMAGASLNGVRVWKNEKLN